MNSFIVLLIAGIFTENLVTSKLFGISEVSAAKTTPINLIRKCGVLSALLFVATAAAFPVNYYLLPLLDVEYLAPVVSVIIISGLIFATFAISKKILPAVYGFLKEHETVLICSAAVFGMVLTASQNELVTGFGGALLYALASGIGFTIVAFIFYGIHYRLEETNFPATLKGLPMTLIIASLISLAFSGLA
jgi:electron transport complex protein RnfA